MTGGRAGIFAKTRGALVVVVSRVAINMVQVGEIEGGWWWVATGIYGMDNG